MRAVMVVGLACCASAVAMAGEIRPGGTGEIKRETWGCVWDAWRSLGTFNEREHFRRYILMAESDRQCVRLAPGTKISVENVSSWYGATQVRNLATFQSWWVTSAVLHENAAAD